jgi:hypothetical protein
VTMRLVGRSGFRNSERSRNFFSSKNVQTGPGAQPTPNSMDTGIISPSVKRPGYGVDFAEVTNEWKYTSAPFTSLYGLYKNKCFFMGTYYHTVRKLVNKERTS